MSGLATSTASQDARARWLRLRWPLAVLGVVLAVALVGALSTPRSSGGRLDPDSAAPAGSRAVAQIMAERGVDVARLRRIDEAAAAAPGSTLVVVNTLLLGPQQLDRLAATGADLVLVEPDALALQRLAPGVQPAGVVEARDADPGCPLPAAGAAGRVRAGGHLYRGAGTGCYPDRQDRAGHSLRQLDVAGHRVSVLGQSEVLTNEHLADAGNAALALRLLGARPQLVLVPAGPDRPRCGRGPADPARAAPDWVRWSSLQLAVWPRWWRCCGGPAGSAGWCPSRCRWWSGPRRRRRAGPGCTGRSGARGRAAATLRTAALRRLAARLDVPPQAAPGDVADLVAAATGRPASEVREHPARPGTGRRRGAGGAGRGPRRGWSRRWLPAPTDWARSATRQGRAEETQ